MTDYSTLINQNQAVIDSTIGTANYDLGHVFFVGYYGAGFGLACEDGTKAKSGAGFWLPLTGVDVGRVAHEFGHMYSALHTWSGLSCPSDQYVQDTAYEPGSGSTLMSYAGGGSCGDAEHYQIYRDLYFHSGSYDRIASNILFGTSSTCPIQTPTGNRAPIVRAPGNFAIPSRTPFTLTATATDPDGDPLTYCWEERDLGPQLALSAADNGASPLFRSFPPSTNPSRTFPQWDDILGNRKTPGERLPTTTRTLHFRVTARDNRAGGGGVSRADTEVSVLSNAGPFVVTAPAAGATWSRTGTVTWDVAGTTHSPIGAQQVDILLSTNGGRAFAIALATNIPNDGSHTVTLPELYTTQARIKVQAAGNIFFAVSPGDLTILPTAPRLVANGYMIEGEDGVSSNAAVDPGERVTVAFALKNVELIEAADLSVSLLSGRGVMAPTPASASGALAPGATGTYQFSFTADPGLPCGGMLTTRLQVTGGGRDLGVIEAPLPVGKTIRTVTKFANNANLNLIGTNPSSAGSIAVYPSFLKVSGLPGTIAHLKVTLAGLSHDWISDLDALLVGPGGQTVVLISDAGSTTTAGSASLVFDDDAPAMLPALGQIRSGTYRPTDLPPDDFYAFPAPSGPFGDRLAVFNGTNPNGYWKLFLMNDGGDNGTLAGGWRLDIATDETTCNSRGDLLAIAITDTPDPARPSAALSYSLTVTNVGTTAATHVVATQTFQPAADDSLSFVPSQGAAALVEGLLRWEIGLLAPATSATLTSQITPRSTGTWNVSATVTSDQPDLNPSNDSTRVSTTVTAPLLLLHDSSVVESLTGSRTLLVTVRLSEPSDQTVTVRFATDNGSALAGTDYVATNGALTFNPGQTLRTVPVTALANSRATSNPTFLFELSDATNALISQRTATLTIDGVAPYRLTVNDASVGEGDSGFTNLVFTVKLSRTNTLPVTVRYATADITATNSIDYLSTNGVLTFLPGETSQTVSVQVRGDTLSEALTALILGNSVKQHETFALRLSNPTNAVLGLAMAVGTIVDDDPLPELRIADASVSGDPGGANQIIFDLSLSAPRGQETKVSYATANDSAVAGVDYVGQSGTLKFAAGVTHLPVAIGLLSNPNANSNRVFLIRLTKPVDTRLVTAQAVGAIVHEPRPALTAELAGAHLRLHLSTQAARHYRIEYRDTLSSLDNWKELPIAADLAGTGEVATVEDPLPVNGIGRSRFYRALVLP